MLSTTLCVCVRNTVKQTLNNAHLNILGTTDFYSINATAWVHCPLADHFSLISLLIQIVSIKVAQTCINQSGSQLCAHHNTANTNDRHTS